MRLSHNLGVEINLKLLRVQVFVAFLRFARSNSIFLGLWFGCKKPDFLTFLQPFSKEFQDIYTQGND